jgi:short-subunit dehydrogenase
MTFIASIRHALKFYTRGPAILSDGLTLIPAIVITGGSEGLGKGFALRLADEAPLVLVARDGEELQAAAREVKQRTPSARVEVLALDVADVTAPETLRAFLDARGLYVDVLINNAGTGPGGRFDLLGREQARNVIDVNVRGLVELTRAFLPDMRNRRAGGIINVASLAGFMPGPWQALYFASKAFVLSYSQALARENADCGVVIMAAAPGPIETKIHHRMRTRHTWYRFLFPSLEPEDCASIVWKAFTRGQTIFVPGALNSISAFAARLLPFEILVPIAGWLVRPRLRSGRPQD